MGLPPAIRALWWAMVACCVVAVVVGCGLDRMGLVKAVDGGGTGGTASASPTGGGGTLPTGGNGGMLLMGGGGIGGVGLSGGSGGAGGGSGLSGGSGGSGPLTISAHILTNDRDAWDDLQGGNLDRAAFGDSQWNDSGGYQFSLPIPPGSTILDATLGVYSTGHGGGTGSYSATIRVEDTSTPQPFTGVAHDIRDRSYWSSYVSWQIPSGGLVVNQRVSSPSIATLIQYAVDLPSWQADHYVSLAIWGGNSGGGCREEIADRSAGAPNAARLRVTYSPP